MKVCLTPTFIIEPKKSEEERVQEKEEYDKWFDGLYDSAKNGELPD